MALVLVGQALSLAGAAALVAAGRRHRTAGLVVLVAVAALGRLALVDSEPIQETDAYRYLWDGQVLAAGIDPYRHAPLTVFEVATLGQNRGAHPAATLAELDRLEALRTSSPGARRTFARISHPELPTIYPPLAIAVFAAAGRAAPWRLDALRWTFLALDLAAVLLLVSIVDRAGRPRGWVALYAWSPLVLKEFVNSPHLDPIALTPLVLFLWLWQRDRTRLAAAALGLSVLGKLFALVLVPVYLASLWSTDRRRAIAAAVVFGAVVAAGYLPFLDLGSLGAFLSRWNSNEGASGLVRWALTGLLGDGQVVFLGAETGRAEVASKVVCALAFLAWVARSSRRAAAGADFAAGSLACRDVLGALFLLSAVAQPWYAAWFLCLCCLAPSGPLLLMASAVVLYYVDFLTRSVGADEAMVVVRWFEYAPVWIWLAIQTRRRGHCGRRPH